MQHKKEYFSQIGSTYYAENFITNHLELYRLLVDKIDWDSSMKSRNTSSFGKAYNYSNISYRYRDFIPEIKDMIDAVGSIVGYCSNNCLVNYYLDGNSSMGYHSDEVSCLKESTGIAIISLGQTRTISFKNIKNPDLILDLELRSGSLFYMGQDVQKEWKHAILKSETKEGRISLTFRSLVD